MKPCLPESLEAEIRRILVCPVSVSILRRVESPAFEGNRFHTQSFVVCGPPAPQPAWSRLTRLRVWHAR